MITANQPATVPTFTSSPQEPEKKGLAYVPQRLLAPVPLFLLQPLLHRIVTHTALNRPELFSRLGPHQDKRFLIDPLNLPFVLLLCPDPSKPRLRAYRRSRLPSYDARISGTFLTLLDMVDGRLDGDALFFTRDLLVEGDTEATVVLRNALDDLDGSIVDEVVAALGLLSAPAQLSLKALRRFRSPG